LKEYPAMQSVGWDINILNFEIENPDNYYFAFHFCDNTFNRIFIDNVKIDSGEFIGVPDITINKVYTPVWSCTLSTEEIIGAEVANIGTAEIQEFTLTYQINESTPVSQTFNKTIGISKSETVYFEHVADFSSSGEYLIKFSVSTPDEVNTNNNEFENIVNSSSITNFPFESDFQNDEDIINWFPESDDSWILQMGFYISFQDHIPLLSRCISMVQGEYNFTYIYQAGYFSSLGSNFYITYGKSGTEPSTWLPVKEYENIFTDNQLVEEQITIKITETSDYVFAFMPVTSNGLQIYYTLIDKKIGISEKVNDINLSLYPNPAKEELKIVSGELRMKNLTVYKVTGQVVMEISDIYANPFRIDTDKLNSGLYFITVQTENGIVNSKFVKK